MRRSRKDLPAAIAPHTILFLAQWKLKTTWRLLKKLSLVSFCILTGELQKFVAGPVFGPPNSIWARWPVAYFRLKYFISGGTSNCNRTYNGYYSDRVSCSFESKEYLWIIGLFWKICRWLTEEEFWEVKYRNLSENPYSTAVGCSLVSYWNVFLVSALLPGALSKIGCFFLCLYCLEFNFAFSLCV